MAVKECELDVKTSGQKLERFSKQRELERFIKRCIETIEDMENLVEISKALKKICDLEDKAKQHFAKVAGYEGEKIYTPRVKGNTLEVRGKSNGKEWSKSFYLGSDTEPDSLELDPYEEQENMYERV